MLFRSLPAETLSLTLECQVLPAETLSLTFECQVLPAETLSLTFECQVSPAETLSLTFECQVLPAETLSLTFECQALPAETPPASKILWKSSAEYLPHLIFRLAYVKFLFRIILFHALSCYKINAVTEYV